MKENFEIAFGLKSDIAVLTLFFSLFLAQFFLLLGKFIWVGSFWESFKDHVRIK